MYCQVCAPGWSWFEPGVLLFTHMEPQQTEVESVISPLKTVTPLSKYLAMTLFIILPFLGGYIGYTLAPEKVIEVANVDLMQESKPVTQNRDSYSEKTAESTFKIFPVVSEECKDILSDPDQYYAVYANDLTLGQKHRCDYERLTGQTYELSSSTIRIISWELAQELNSARSVKQTEYKNINITKDLEIHTQLPYLISLVTTSSEMILTSHCFVAKACSFGGLYKFDLLTNTLSRMKTSDLFNITSRASRVSPDKTKIISSDDNYDGASPNNLYLIDLKTDTYKILDTINPSEGEGKFCTMGMGGCADLVVDWLADSTVAVQIFKEGGQKETRRYPLD